MLPPTAWASDNFKTIFETLVDKGLPLSAKQQRQLCRHKAHVRSITRATGHADAVGTFGQLVQVAEYYVKAKIHQRGVFHYHCPFVIGMPLALPPTVAEVEQAKKDNDVQRAALNKTTNGKKRLTKGQTKITRGNVCIVFSTQRTSFSTRTGSSAAASHPSCASISRTGSFLRSS